MASTLGTLAAELLRKTLAGELLWVMEDNITIKAKSREVSYTIIGDSLIVDGKFLGAHGRVQQIFDKVHKEIPMK